MIVKCPECGSKGRLSEKFAGRKIRCPQCGAGFSANEKNTVQPEVKWYYAEGQEKVGPLVQQEFERLIGKGTITPGTLVWLKGMAGWQPLAEVLDDKKSPAVDQKELSIPRGHADTGLLPGAGRIDHWEIEAAGAAGLNYAGVGKRFGAKIIDLIFMLTMASLAGGLSRKLYPEAYASVDLGNVYALLVAINLLLWIFYHTWFVGKFGATPGKMVFNLKIVTPTGGRVGYARAFGRFCGEFVLGLSLALGPAIAAFMFSRQNWLAVTSFIVTLILFYSPSLFDSQKRGLYDRLLDTRVVVA
jgi:uncharacterized RDD family membrane protein YckC